VQRGLRRLTGASRRKITLLCLRSLQVVTVDSSSTARGVGERCSIEGRHRRRRSRRQPAPSAACGGWRHRGIAEAAIYRSPARWPPVRRRGT